MTYRLRVVLGAIVFVLLGTIFFVWNEWWNVQDRVASEVTVISEDEYAFPFIEPTDHRDLERRTASVTEVARGLDAPWAFVWLPSGEMLVTERFGALKLLTQEGKAVSVSGVPEVLTSGQGGLLDVTIHPNFSDNRLVYLSYAHGTAEENRLRVARGEFRENSLQNVEVIFETAETKTGSQHFGSRFLWLPDGTLLFSVGDGGNPPTSYNGAPIREQAQNLGTHFGKIIRINDDGSVPGDNPFVGRPDAHPEIYSYGHRNVQGLAYDPIRGRVIASEHGSKGGDELNEIIPGGNYGWPLATFATEYDAFGTAITPHTTLPATKNPRVAWTPTIAPSTLVLASEHPYGGGVRSIFLAGMLLRNNTSITAYATRSPGAVFQIEMGEDGAVVNQRVIDLGEVRVRSVAFGPDGFLYALTDTTATQNRPGTNAGALVRIEMF